MEIASKYSIHVSAFEIQLTEVQPEAREDEVDIEK